MAASSPYPNAVSAMLPCWQRNRSNNLSYLNQILSGFDALLHCQMRLLSGAKMIMTTYTCFMVLTPAISSVDEIDQVAFDSTFLQDIPRSWTFRSLPKGRQWTMWLSQRFLLLSGHQPLERFVPYGGHKIHLPQDTRDVDICGLKTS